MSDKPAEVKDTKSTPEQPAASPAAASDQAPVAAAAKPAEAKKPGGGSSKMIIIIVAVVALVGGGMYLKNRSDKNKEEKAAESFLNALTGSDVDYDSDSGSISVKDGEGDEEVSFETNQKLPSDFPKEDVPYLDEKKVTVVFSATNDGKKSWTVTTSVKESLEEATAYFEGEFVEPDYMDISTYGYNESKSFSAKSEKYGILVTVSKYDTDEDTMVTYVIDEED